MDDSMEDVLECKKIVSKIIDKLSPNKTSKLALYAAEQVTYILIYKGNHEKEIAELKDIAQLAITNSKRRTFIHSDLLKDAEELPIQNATHHCPVILSFGSAINALKAQKDLYIKEHALNAIEMALKADIDCSQSIIDFGNQLLSENYIDQN